MQEDRLADRSGSGDNQPAGPWGQFFVSLPLVLTFGEGTFIYYSKGQWVWSSISFVVFILFGIFFNSGLIYSLFSNLSLLKTEIGTLRSKGKISAHRAMPAISPPSFPRIWALFAYLLPREIRERVYEPAHQELLEDYLEARRRFRTKGACRWLTFCFTVRTAMMWAESLRVMACSKGAKALRWLVYGIFGGQAIRAMRGVLFELFGRLF
jgi:hypothetical protein